MLAAIAVHINMFSFVMTDCSLNQ